MTYLKINLLNEDTIQKIAAGEVVERPQSIIKELVENSIDADADDIVVEIKKGGKEFIKVTDNGFGIDKDEIEKAFYRHATSKINDFEDLYKIYTMGFRGEALASIVAVSSLDIYSKTKDSDFGMHLSYDNNKLISKKPVGMNYGTIIEVRNLFEYLPVRRKFLSSDISEANKITSLMYSFAIANVGISITYIKDDKLIFKTHKDNSLKDNLRILFGNDYANNILEINSKLSDYKVSGFISNNSFYKGNRSMQYIFVNGRFIEDLDLVNHIESQYHTIIPNGRFPAFQLFIDTDPKNIDVNISPNKQKIKFSFADELFEELKTVIKDTLIESQRIMELKIDKKEEFKPNFYDLNSGDSYEKILDLYTNPKKETLKNDDLNELNKDNLSKDFSKEEIDDNSLNNQIDSSEINDLDIDIIDIDEEEFNDDNFSIESPIEKEKLNDEYIIKEEDSSQSFNIEAQYLGSLFDRYMIFQEFSKDELLIIDQLRARERILFDKLVDDINESKFTTTDLLSPIIVDLGPKDFEKFQLNKKLLNDFGFSIDEFGASTIAIRSVPYIGDKACNKDIFLNIFDNMSKNSTKDEYISILKKKSLGLAIHKVSNLDKDHALEIYKNLKKSSNQFATETGKKIMFTLSEDDFERILNR